MANQNEVTVQRLGGQDLGKAEAVLDVFADAFEEPDVYRGRRADEAYLSGLLAKDHVIVLAAIKDGAVVGGLVAYEFEKLEQARSEIYIYDLAVDEGHRRRGIATALITEVKSIAKACGAWIIFIQADQGEVAPVTLYSKLGTREDVHHFDIPID